jgi:flagellar assembly factor FliW
MRFESPRWGVIEVEDDKVITFESGLPGFPDCTQFIVMDHDRETPLKWLQCVERPEVAFLIVEPEQVLASYEVEVPESVLGLLQLEDPERADDIAVFVILNVEEKMLTANLRAPVVVNVQARRAYQLILDDPNIPLQQEISPA